jgi:hypothetical protein
MKTNNAKKLLKILDVNPFYAYDRISNYLPKELSVDKEIRNKIDGAYGGVYYAWEVALCRKHKRSIDNPSRARHWLDKEPIECVVKMLKNYIRKNTMENGCVNWSPLFSYLY